MNADIIMTEVKVPLSLNSTPCVPDTKPTEPSVSPSHQIMGNDAIVAPTLVEWPSHEWHRN